jgi:hypothetical protein
MKKLAFTLIVSGAAAFGLAACSGNNDDAVNNAELNQPAAEDLNSLANEAANNAQDQALGNMQDQNAAADVNTTTPSDAVENNIDAM